MLFFFGGCSFSARLKAEVVHEREALLEQQGRTSKEDASAERMVGGDHFSFCGSLFPLFVSVSPRPASIASTVFCW
jgi:hypothetical protein